MYTWQYNGVAPWYRIIEWCVENIEHWQSQYETITFFDGPEYTAFILRWS